MPDDISEYEYPVEDSQTGHHSDGDRTASPGTTDRGRSITRRNALFGGGSLAVATLLNRSGTVAEGLRTDPLSETTATDTQTTDEEQVRYTLTVTDSAGNEVGSATVTGTYDLSTLGERITFGVFGDFAGDGDNAIADHVRLGDGRVVENWSDRTLEDDYTKTRDNNGEFDLVSSPTADGPQALRMFTGFKSTNYTSNDDLLAVEPGLTVNVDLRHETDVSNTFAMRSVFAFGTVPDGKQAGDSIAVDMANPGSERAEGGRLRTPNGTERIDFVPNLEEFYTFTVDVSTSPIDETQLRLDARPVQTVFNTTLSENMDLVAGKDTALVVYPTVENLESIPDDAEITLSVTGQVEDSADSDLSWEGTLPGSRATLTKDDLETFVSKIKQEETRLERTEFLGRELQSTDGIPGLPLSGTVEMPETADAAEQEKAGTLGVSASTTDGSVRIEADSVTDVTVHRTGGIRLIVARSEGVDDDNPDFNDFSRHVEDYLEAVFPVSESGFNMSESTVDPVAVDLASFSPWVVSYRLDELFWAEYDPVQGAETFFLVVVTDQEMTSLIGSDTNGFTYPGDFETMFVQFGQVTTVAHELGHQFGLHNGAEEYAITDTVEHTVDGYWVNQPEWVETTSFFKGEPIHFGHLRQQLGEENDAAAPYMADGDKPNQGWPSNTEDYETKSTGPVPIVDSTTERRDFGDPFETLTETYTAATSAQAGSDLTRQQDSSSGPGFSVAGPESRVLYVKAAITDKEDVELGNLHYYEDARPVETDPTGEFSLVGTTDDDTTLVDKSFSVPESACTVPDGDLEQVETAPVSFAMAYPAGITNIEIQRQEATGADGTTVDAEQTTLATFDPRVEVLRGELASVPENGFEADDPDTIRGTRENLREIIDDIETLYEDGDDEAAGESIRTEFEPALDQALRDDYEANEPLERSRQSIRRSVEDTVARSVNPVVPYTNDEGVVDADGLRTAIDDWRAGEIDTELLRDVLDAWRTGQPVV